MQRQPGQPEGTLVQIVLQQKAVWAGDVVCGSVFFHNPRQPVHYDEVYAEFVGKEKVDTVEDGVTSATPFSHKAGLLIRAKLPLAAPGPGVLPVGCFEVPFAFTVPEDLTGSTLFRDKEVEAAVMYKFKVAIVQAGVFSKAFKGQEEIKLLQRPPRHPMPKRVEEMAPTGTCCFGGGSLALTVELPADVHWLGHSYGVPCNICVNNGSKSSITSATASLVKVNVITWRSGFEESCSWHNHTVACIDLRAAPVPPPLSSLPPSPPPAIVSCPSTSAQSAMPLKTTGASPSSSAAVGVPALSVQSALAASSVSGGEPRVIPPGASLVMKDVLLPLDPLLEPTTNGQLLKQWYELRVEAKTDALCAEPVYLATGVLICSDPSASMRYNQHHQQRADVPAKSQRSDVVCFVVDRRGGVKMVPVAEFEAMRGQRIE